MGNSSFTRYECIVTNWWHRKGVSNGKAQAHSVNNKPFIIIHVSMYSNRTINYPIKAVSWLVCALSLYNWLMSDNSLKCDMTW